MFHCFFNVLMFRQHIISQWRAMIQNVNILEYQCIWVMTGACAEINFLKNLEIIKNNLVRFQIRVLNVHVQNKDHKNNRHINWKSLLVFKVYSNLKCLKAAFFKTAKNTNVVFTIWNNKTFRNFIKSNDGVIVIVTR